jgi:hypothetical protein
MTCHFASIAFLKKPGVDFIRELDKVNMSRVFVVGTKPILMHLMLHKHLIKIDNPSNNAPNEVTMLYNPGFTTLRTSVELQTKLAGFSPLLAPYGEYIPSASAQVLAYQRIGKVDTQFPLILMEKTMIAERVSSPVKVCGNGNYMINCKMAPRSSRMSWSINSVNTPVQNLINGNSESRHLKDYLRSLEEISSRQNYTMIIMSWSIRRKWY